MKRPVVPNLIKKGGLLSPAGPTRLKRIFTILLLALLCISVGWPAHAVQNNYELSIGDVITFDILDDAEIPVTLTIGDNGQAQFPVMGGVEIAGHSLSDAIEIVRAEYRNRQILLDPKISISISAFRPLFVLGEVRNPGSYPFFAGLTVEQAVGLAGGTQTITSNPADRIITQARLRGDIESSEAGIIHDAVYSARLVAQLAGRKEINLEDAPKAARAFLKDAPLEAILEIEKRILKTDQANFNTQVDILTNGIAEAEKGLKLLDDLAEQQKLALQSIKDDLERINSLRKSGLNTQAEVLRAERAETSEKTRLIEIFGEMSRARREFGSLKLELARLKADREKDLLQILQERQLAIEQLMVSRRSAQQQLILISSIAVDEKKQAQTIAFSYEVRRTSKGKTNNIPATTLTELSPGDVVIVTIASM
jgi:protein involved in polysaccharide export with SLBB domain